MFRKYSKNVQKIFSKYSKIIQKIFRPLTTSSTTTWSINLRFLDRSTLTASILHVCAHPLTPSINVVLKWRWYHRGTLVKRPYLPDNPQHWNWGEGGDMSLTVSEINYSGGCSWSAEREQYLLSLFASTDLPQKGGTGCMAEVFT